MPRASRSKPTRVDSQRSSRTAKTEPDPASKLFRPSKIRPKSDGQRELIEAIDRATIVFAAGPAGSGKTYLAVAKACEMLATGDVTSIVLLRPCIGVGMTSGFLPGDLKAKVSLYLRPLLDELRNFHTAAGLRDLVEAEAIELTSLEYSRGRTFKRACVILDEAQNATHADFRVFLTRLGEGSKYIVTGDLDRADDGSLKQCDLRRADQGAFEEYSERFAHLPGIANVRLASIDIVRHPLVRLMVEAGL
jgi:phosphate starvation-inducible PhoH-like protein